MIKRLIRLLFCTGLLAGLLTVTALAADTWTYTPGSGGSGGTLTNSGNTVILQNVTDDGNKHLTIGDNKTFSGDLDLRGQITDGSSTEYTITAIGDNAFFYCYSLNTLTLPDSLTYIGERAFFNCSKLSSMDLSGCTGLTNIASYTFSGCSSLNTLTLPDSLTSIRAFAFQYCTSLTELVVLAETPPSLDAFSLYGVNALSRILVPAGSVEDYKQASIWSSYANSIQALSFGLSVAPDDPSQELLPAENPQPMTFTVTNSSNVTVSGLKVALSDSEHFTLDTSGMAASLAPNSTTTFTVTPKSGLAAGSYSTDVNVTSRISSVPATATLTCTVKKVGISADPASLDFGSVYTGYTQPEAKTITVTNMGEVAVTLTQPASQYYDVSIDDGLELPLNGKVTFTVRPIPGLGAGEYSETLTISDQSGGPVKSQVLLNFKVVDPVYGISADTTVCDFGTVVKGYSEAPAGKDVTIINTGNQAVTVELPTSTNYIVTAGAGFTGDKAALSPGGKARFTVRPKTDLGAGEYSETLTISGSDGTDEKISLSFEVLATYTLTVDLGGGSGSITGGEYPAGKEIEIDAGSRSNYRFNGWTSSNGGSFADASSASTTFTMPAADTTITAAWSYNGGGGSSGSATYAVTVTKTEHGTVTLSSSRAAKGITVTVTATADEGYELASLTVTDSSGNALELTDKGSGKYTFTMPASRVTVEAVFAEIPPEPLPFTDVAENAWYAEAVRYVYEHGLMAGTSTTTFAPDATTSRSMIATILWRMAGSPVVNFGLDYTDVAQGQWYSEAIRWAASEGVVTGYGGGLFGPDDPITREQFAVMLYRYAQEQGYDVSIGENTNILFYTDVADLSEYAISAMQWAVGAGIINGTGDGSTLTPQGQATRAQAAVMLMRFGAEYVVW